MNYFLHFSFSLVFRKTSVHKMSTSFSENVHTAHYTLIQRATISQKDYNNDNSVQYSF